MPKNIFWFSKISKAQRSSFPQVPRSTNQNVRGTTGLERGFGLFCLRKLVLRSTRGLPASFPAVFSALVHQAWLTCKQTMTCNSAEIRKLRSNTKSTGSKTLFLLEGPGIFGKSQNYGTFLVRRIRMLPL